MATLTVTSGLSPAFASGDTVTPDKLNLLGTPTVAISNIVNADVSASAAIAASKINLAGAGLGAWQSKTTTYTAVAGDRISANTSGGAFTVTLPSSPNNFDEVTLADNAGTWDTNNLTVARNGNNINGLAENLVCDVEAKQIVLRYEGATIGWRIYT